MTLLPTARVSRFTHITSLLSIINSIAIRNQCTLSVSMESWHLSLHIRISISSQAVSISIEHCKSFDLQFNLNAPVNNIQVTFTDFIRNKTFTVSFTIRYTSGTTPSPKTYFCEGVFFGEYPSGISSSPNIGSVESSITVAVNPEYTLYTPHCQGSCWKCLWRSN